MAVELTHYLTIFSPFDRCRILNTLLPNASQEALLGHNYPNRLDEVATPDVVSNLLFTASNKKLLDVRRFQYE